MKEKPNKGWLLDKSVEYGHPCANYSETMKWLDSLRRQSNDTIVKADDPNTVLTKAVRDAVQDMKYPDKDRNLKFLNSVMGFKVKSEKQMNVVKGIAKRLKIKVEGF